MSLWLVVAALACSGATSDSVAPPGNPAEVVVTPGAPSVVVGSQVALQAQVHDASGKLVSGATVFWSSSDTTIAVVSPSGVVTGINLGSAQIAASAGGQSALVPLQVVPVPVASVAVLPATASVTVGASMSLQLVAYDADGHTLTGRAVVWASSAPQIATVDSSGRVTGVAAGTATITGTSEGKSAASSVTVGLVPVAAVAVSPGAASLTTGQAAAFTATASDANGNVLSGRLFTWSSANTAIATVSAQGLVTAAGPGTTTITAAAEGKTGSAQIVVTPVAATPVASVAVSPPTASVIVGGNVTLSATLRDANGATLSGRTVTWSSSAAQVATVSNTGVVTAVATGTATITATSEGKSGTAVVTVQPPPPPAAAVVRVTPSTLSLHRNQFATLTAQVLDASGNVLTGRTITWSSSNAATVSVTPSGQTAIALASNHVGTVTITATCSGVNGTATVTVQ
ncbi:MAG: Ig-like domain-containing protein [Gemmatimonadota bacterium]|nr:Ig-like domain-containing protein [Gemmatimonadota bacterium]